MEFLHKSRSLFFRTLIIVISIGVLVLLVTEVSNYVRSSTKESGTVSSWLATTNLPIGTSSATSIVYKGYIYEIGGCGTVCPTSAVYYAPIVFNGVPGSWEQTTSLPTATFTASSVVYNGYLYEIGGGNESKDFSTVDFARIRNDGTLGAWTPTTMLPLGLYGASSVAHDGYLYEMGGISGSQSFSTVDFARIRNNGTLGAWMPTTRLPAATKLASSIVYNGYLYEIGGTYGGKDFSTVDFARIRNNGTLGAWTPTTMLPLGLYGASSVAHDGYLYEMGGISGSESFSTVDFARIRNNGTLGAWMPTTMLPINLSWATAVTYNGFIYEIGGWVAPAPAASVFLAKIVGKRK